MTRFAALLSALLLLPCSLARSAPSAPVTLVRGGRPVATIVIAADASRSAAFAAWELQYHLRKVTGALLPIVSDTAAVAGARILVGESAATRRLGLRSSGLKAQEYLIRSLPGALLLMGRDGAERAGSAVQFAGAPRSAPGRAGRALRFDGVRDGLTVKDSGFSDEAGSLSLWVETPREPALAEATILRVEGGDPLTYHVLRRMDRRVVYAVSDGQTVGTVASSDLPAGWHHLVATHDRASRRAELFVDGASQGTATFGGSSCKGADLGIGAAAGARTEGEAGGRFRGAVDEVCVSTLALKPGQMSDLRIPPPGATLALHLDEPVGALRDSSGARQPAAPPAHDEQATCYAVYDFLERCCGVRWYAPTELGMVCPARRSLAVAGLNVRRAPAFRFRQGTYLPVYGLLRALWNNPSQADVELFARRMRLGGEAYAANHSFYGFYDRFWARNPQNPGVFEAAHPEWFAQGYTGKPDQLCYTNPGLAAQVVSDARSYFDGKGAPPGAFANGDFFALVPMDANGWCRCAACQSRLNPAEAASPQFTNGHASDYIFGFANEIARQIRTSHPGKYLATLAYWEYAAYPAHVRLESNIAVQLCLHVRNWWQPSMEANDLRVYRSWTTRERDRPIYLWLYYCFPEEIAMNGGWRCFPGFFAHTIDRQWRMFARDGIRGAFLNNLGDYLDTYVTFKYMDDPNQNIDRVIDEFHRLYYGPAADPMKRLYLTIERTFSDPANYPAEVRSANRHTHQTEEMAWGALGTEARMAEMARLMARAKQLAATDLERQRVALFEHGIWDYMVEGRRAWVSRRPPPRAEGGR